LSGKARRNTGISGREPGSTSGSRHGVGDLFSALRRQGLIADELVLQLATFLRSLDLFLELIVLAPRTLTAKCSRLCELKRRWVEMVEHAPIADEDKWKIFALLMAHDDARLEEVPGLGLKVTFPPRARH
jgi:hypothetical protein